MEKDLKVRLNITGAAQIDSRQRNGSVIERSVILECAKACGTCDQGLSITKCNKRKVKREEELTE